MNLKIFQGKLYVYSMGKIFRQVSHHRRIDKFCFNNINTGVSRSWNMGTDADPSYRLGFDVAVFITIEDRLFHFMLSYRALCRHMPPVVYGLSGCTFFS